MAPHKTHTLALPLLLSGILAAGLIFSSCTELSKKERQKVNEALQDSLISSTETWDVDMTLIEEGVKKVRLQGTYAASINSEHIKETRIKGPVHIDVFDSAGTVETEVRSNSAIYRSEQSEFELFGDVRVKSREDRRLESEYLKWNQATNRISTPRFVIITTPSDSIAGSGFEGTTDLSSYTIREPKGRVIVD